MLAGFAKTDITPALPCELGGFACRTELAHTVATPLYARAMAVQQEDVRWILISLDLLGVSAGFADALSRRLGIPVSVIATHTHCAPNGLPEELDRGLWTEARHHVPVAYATRVQEAAYTAALHALDSMQSVFPRWTVAECPQAYTNRRRPDLPCDSRVHLLQLYTSGDRLLGGLVHLGCHPTVVDPFAYHVSGDLAGYVTARLEQDDTVFLFANGAAGDISTRFSRREKTEAEAWRLSGLICDSLNRAAALSAGNKLSFREYREVYPDRFTGTPLQTTYQQVALAGMELLFCPGEFYTHYARRLPPQRLLVGYANGYIGYVPDTASLQESGYEAAVCRLSEASVTQIQHIIGQWPGSPRSVP